MLERVRSTPGVIAAGTTLNFFLVGSPFFSLVQIEHQPQPDGQPYTMQFRRISPGYFDAMKIVDPPGPRLHAAGSRRQRAGGAGQPIAGRSLLAREPGRRQTPQARRRELAVERGGRCGRRRPRCRTRPRARRHGVYADSIKAAARRRRSAWWCGRKAIRSDPSRRSVAPCGQSIQISRSRTSSRSRDSSPTRSDRSGSAPR